MTKCLLCLLSIKWLSAATSIRLNSFFKVRNISRASKRNSFSNGFSNIKFLLIVCVRHLKPYHKLFSTMLSEFLCYSTKVFHVTVTSGRSFTVHRSVLRSERNSSINVSVNLSCWPLRARRSLIDKVTFNSTAIQE